MSGSALAPWVIRKNPRADAAFLGAALGCHDSNPKVLVDCLREQPAEEIVRVQKAMTVQLTSLLYLLFNNFIT